MSVPTKILLVDDDEDYFFIAESFLEDAPGEFALEWVSNYAAGLKRLKDAEHDVCLVDYMIGSEVGLDFVQQAKCAGIKCPMVLLTGIGQHDIDLAASEAGASDFLDKANLTPTLLERAVRYSVANARAMQTQKEQAIILETTLRSIQAGVAMFDASGKLKTANEMFAELVTPDNLPERWHASETLFVPSQVEEMGERLLQYFLAADAQAESEFEDNRGRTFDVRVDPIEGGGNVMLLTDVTAQKSLQKSILEAKQAAESASQMKSAFLAKVSHELRTPLNGVFGMSQLLKISKLDETQERNLQVLVDSASTLMDLIEDLLDLSIIEQGAFVQHNETFEIQKLLAEARDVAIAASHDGFRIETSCDSVAGVPYFGDRRRILQIIVNFLSNAAKFAGASTVELSAELVSAGLVRFSAKDGGPGIDTEAQNRIFKRFAQAKERTSERSGGFGLGLSIAKELVEQMNGKIGVISSPGEGAEFWFEIPLAGSLQGPIEEKVA